MNIFKRIFSSNKQSGVSEKWKMFSTSKGEVHELLVDMGEAAFDDNTITFINYPFEPSIVYKEATLNASSIDDIDTTGHPPTVKTGNELIFVGAKQRNELIKFATDNAIKTVKREDIWSWILEPFLDTEYTNETNNALNKLLAEYGLNEKSVCSLRQEVKIQMLKYNFDTMLWDWVNLNAPDVLRAMRTKYNTEEYRKFYRKVMDIALLTKK